MFERFTDRARQVVVLAQAEARALRHGYIGTEHLLLGLLREEEGLASQVLGSLDVSIDDVRERVVLIVGEGDEVPTGQIPFTPRAKKALERSLREAISLGHRYIGTEHILLGVASVNDSVSWRVLADIGVGADELRDEVIRRLSGFAARGTTPPGETADDPFEPQSPPLAPDVEAELARLSREREEALQQQNHERAARLRKRERRLIRACRDLIRVWNERDELT